MNPGNGKLAIAILPQRWFYYLHRMKELIIIGARGFGREMYSLALQCKEYGKDWIIKGFLDDNAMALDGYQNYPPILGPVESYIPQANDVFVSGLGGVEFKEKYVSIILSKGGQFVNLIHPSVVIYPNAQLGKGITVNAFTVLGNDIKVADFVTIQGYVVLAHDVEVGEWSHITAFSFMAGFTKVGKRVTIYMGAKIIDRRTIGDGATIGAGSVVIRNVKPGVTVFGYPAKEV